MKDPASYIQNILKKASLTACLFVFAFHASFAQDEKWKLDDTLLECYNLSLQLKINESRNLLLTYHGPSTYGKVYLEHLNDAFEVFLTEDVEMFNGLEKKTDERIDNIKDGPESPYKGYYLSEIKLHTSFIKIKFGEELSAAWNFRQAYILAEENLEDYTNFSMIRKTLGLMHIIIGSTPEKYHWILNLFGLYGDVPQGIDDLNDFTSHNQEFSLESDIIMSFVYSYLLQDIDKGLNILEKYGENYRNHLLIIYSKASILIKGSRSQDALEVLNGFQESTDTHFPFLDYLKGNIYQEKGDYKTSTNAFRSFLSHYNGHNFLKDAYYKIGLNYWLSGDPQEANASFEDAQRSGARITEADKNASFMLEEDLPDKNIMKLRLATDGGYYEIADSLVTIIKSTRLPSYKDSMEFIYRQARLMHKSGKKDEAVAYYKNTIAITGKEQWYFAPNSALQLGYIYRDLGQFDQSRNYFEKALSYKNHPYKNSIDNKAEAALSAIQDN